LARSRWERPALASVAMLLGLMLTLGFRLQTRYGPTLPNQRWEQLAVLLAQSERERDSLREEIAELRAGAGADPPGVQGITPEQLRQIQLFAGLKAGTGPGIRVHLDDNPRPGGSGDNPNLFLLHDDDIVRVVNELAAAGAEAIAINEQRMVAMTEIRCAGPVISINNTRVAPPIAIVAIGDPATLESALRMRGGVLEILSAIGIQVRIERGEDLTVPAFTGTITTRYLRSGQ